MALVVLPAAIVVVDVGHARRMVYLTRSGIQLGLIPPA